MDLYFVYSSGGGAGDWNGINRIWNEFMPYYFKDNLLIKFGDIFFNHKGIKSLIKTNNWNKITNAREWLVQRTGDKSLYITSNIILDVGTSKIVNYINYKNPGLNVEDIIKEFDKIVQENSILDKYCDFITESNINNAVTFDIPNPFKIRNQKGDTQRSIFGKNSNNLLIDKFTNYANYIHQKIDDNNRILTIIPAFLSSDEISRYLLQLNYRPTKLAISGLTGITKKVDFIETLTNINNVINLRKFSKVHFLGSGGLKRANWIKTALGNHPNFSVDNTTPYNRAIDGNTKGTTFSGYYDYVNYNIHRIKPDTKEEIIEIHKNTSNDIKLFSNQEIKHMVDSILKHQAGNSSYSTYNNRAKLIIHNFDVFRRNAL